jgi:hypothetical protein
MLAPPGNQTPIPRPRSPYPVAILADLSLLSYHLPFGLVDLVLIFLIRIVGWGGGGGVPLGRLGTAATNRPIVPTPGDCDDGEIGGMMIRRGNRSTRRNAAPILLCPPQTPHALPGSEPRPPRWEASE